MAALDRPIEAPFPGGVSRYLIPFDARFWGNVAKRVLSYRDLDRWTVIVESPMHGRALRQALGTALDSCGSATEATRMLPRILTLEEWARSASMSRLEVRSPTQRRVELFQALKTTRWLTTRLGASGGQLWALARQLLSICDDLTLCLGRPEAGRVGEAVEQRLLAVLKGSYRHQAWSICSEEAELVLGIWRSTLSENDGAALLLRGLDHLTRHPRGPLCVVAALPMEPYAEAFVARYAQAERVERIEVDVAASLRPIGALASAWPELDGGVEGVVPEAVLVRAQHLASVGSPLTHLRMFAHPSLEDEAACAAQTILDWLAAGRREIGIVALDRMSARRVRALLERAQVLVRDEAGWKFSTATVAGSLMRWLELVSADESQIEASILLDWLKSPHALVSVPAKAEMIAQIELAIRAHNVARGWPRIVAALERSGVARHRSARAASDGAVPIPESGTDPGKSTTARDALQLVKRLRVSAVPLRGRRSLREHFQWLHESLAATAMRASFQADAVGSVLLSQLETLGSELGPDAGGPGFTYSEWREFVADALENITFREQGIESPVIATSMAGAAFRHFDALLVLGADTAHFPTQPPDALFFNGPLRSELGLSDPLEEQRQELASLAVLLAATPEVVVTWRSLIEQHPNPAAAPIERLMLLHRTAFGDDLVRSWSWPKQSVTMHRTVQPAPAAPDLVPLQISASACNLLISCPYRYFVRHMLHLEPLETVREDAEKRDYGEIVHRILERFHRLRPRPGERDELVELLERVGAGVFDEAVGNNAAFMGYRARWNTVVRPYIDWWLDWCTEGWEVAQAEDMRERHIDLVEGGALVLRGRLDRIDRNDTRTTIIDYKAREQGKLKASLNDPGEDVQLPFYRLLMAEAEDVDAAYLSVDQKRVGLVAGKIGLEELSGAVGNRLSADFARLRAGWGLPANGVEPNCSRCDARGLCRKGQWEEGSAAAPQPSSEAPKALRSPEQLSLFELPPPTPH